MSNSNLDLYNIGTRGIKLDLESMTLTWNSHPWPWLNIYDIDNFYLNVMTFIPL